MIWEDAVKMLQEMQLRFDALEQKRQEDELTDDEDLEYWHLDPAQLIRPAWVKEQYDAWKASKTPSMFEEDGA